MSKLSLCFSIYVGLMLVCSVGCQGDSFSLAPVTGVVTANGEPVSGLKVAFYPKPTKENPTPGPFASGTTGDQGNFSLVLRDGREGAVVGVNRVGFHLLGASQSALQSAKDNLNELKGKPQENREDIRIFKEKICLLYTSPSPRD